MKELENISPELKKKLRETAQMQIDALAGKVDITEYNCEAILLNDEFKHIGLDYFSLLYIHPKTKETITCIPFPW